MIRENINWLDQTSADFYGFHGNYHDGSSAVKYYNEKIMLRREKYSFFNASDFPRNVEEIEDKGYSAINGFFSEEQKAVLQNIRSEIIHYVDANECLKKRDASMAFINQPILNLSNLHKIIFDDRIINIATAYFDCVPAVSSVAVRRSFASNCRPANNQLFHRDYNSLCKLLKFIVYFDDVDEEAGPFAYIEESNRKMFQNWWHYHYLQDDILAKIYGQDKIKLLTSNFGDLLMANTRGFHKGLKPVNKERVAMHICFMIHPELTGPGHRMEVSPENGFQIKKEDFNSLPDWKKAAADFLVKV